MKTTEYRLAFLARRAWQFLAPVVILALLLTVSVVPVSAAAETYTIKESYEYEFHEYVGCVGDFIHLEGTINSTIQVLFTPNGGFSYRVTEVFDNVRGYGEYYGGEYMVVGAQGATLQFKNTNVLHFVTAANLITPGSNNNAIAILIEHDTLVDGWNPVSSFFHTVIQCQ